MTCVRDKLSIKKTYSKLDEDAALSGGGRKTTQGFLTFLCQVFNFMVQGCHIS
jgi:hypothetical protein